MPKIDVAAVPVRHGIGYPAPFDAPCAERLRQRHWHSQEAEFVYVLEGEVMLIGDGGETLLGAGDCAAFPKGSGNGHHLINRSDRMALYLEVGSRASEDVTTCSDIDIMCSNADGRFLRMDGSPFPEG